MAIEDIQKIVIQRGTKAECEAYTATITEGMISFATDLNKFGHYDGTSWIWDRLDKLDATTAPTANDDSGDGYSVGSVWIDVTNDKPYLCVDATVTAAVWIEVGGSSLTVEEIDGTPSVDNVIKIKVTNGTLTDDGSGVITLDFGSAATDGAAIHDNVASEISAITEKTTPVAADMLIGEDSENGNAKVMIQIGNLPGGSGGNVATDTIWDTAGDLAVGSGANTAVKLAKGTDGQILKAGASTLEWGGVGWGGVQLLRTVVGAGGQASFDLSSIASGYDLIQVFMHGKSEASASGVDYVVVTLNNDTTNSNYWRTRVAATNAVTNLGEAGDRIMGHFADTSYSSTFELQIIHPDSPFGKTYTARYASQQSAEQQYVGVLVGRWAGTAAINRITITTNSGSDFAEGTLCVIVGYKNFA